MMIPNKAQQPNKKNTEKEDCLADDLPPEPAVSEVSKLRQCVTDMAMDGFGNVMEASPIGVVFELFKLGPGGEEYVFCNCK